MKRAIRWGALAVALIVTVALVGAYLKYRSVWNSIHRVTVTDLGHRPPKYTNALNILVFGSDSRAHLTHRQQRALHVGPNLGSNNTDSIMIVHISPGRHLVTVVNLPRDTVVPYYACAKGPGYPGQQADPSAVERINSLLSAGGPGCLWKTVEQQTGIHIDHFIQLSMVGFVKVINDVGGVNVCVPFAVNDPLSGLRLPAGETHINGIQTLEFWRTREDIGNGSDLERIQRDQFLMAQILQGVLHSGLLSNPARLLSVVSDGAAAMTTDSGLSQSVLLSLASSFRGLSSKNVQFITAPNILDPADPNEVELEQPQATRLFRAIAHDRALPTVAGGRKPAAPPPPAVLARTVSPSQVTVNVLNGSGETGGAGQAAAALEAAGFHVASTGDAPNFGYTGSVVQYSRPHQLAAARTLRRQIAGATLQRVRGLPRGTIQLIAGSDFTGLKPMPSASPSPRPTATHASVAGLSSKYHGITGAASCRSDSGAFAGPLSP